MSEELQDRVPGEVGLRDEAERATRVDELCELGSGLRRDEDDRRPAVRQPGEPLRHVEAAFGAEVDVDEHDVGPQGQRLVDGLVRRRGEADDRDPVVGEELSCGLEELRAVVDDQAGERHVGRLGLSSHAKDRRGLPLRARRRTSKLRRDSSVYASTG